MADKSSSSTHEITYYLNVENAKVLAFLMVSGFVVYHGFIHIKYSNDSCKWLLSDGRFPGYGVWQPYGCMTHKYNKEDSRMCMHYISYWGGYNHITFLGDSRIRQLYFDFVNLLSKEPVDKYKSHGDLHFNDKHINARVDFIWMPFVNTDMYKMYKSWMLNGPRDRPNLIVTGSATWIIKEFNASKDALKNFEANLTYIVPYFEKMKESTDIIWALQDPVVEKRLNANRTMITNEQIDHYNKVALEVFAKLQSSAKIWSSSRLVAQGMKKELVDGIHLSSAALQLDVQMLMNMYCNNQMNHNDGTCCSNPEPTTTLQIIVAAFFLVCMISMFALLIYRRRMRRNGVKIRTENGQRNGGSNGIEQPVTEHSQSLYEVLSSLSKLGIIMAYFYLCDRTNFFMKENKYYTHVNFFLPFAYVMILGFFFNESTDKNEILHRDQTDEWKGWMQLVILIYHITGASKILPIYMHIRVLVSCYLFLTGYGHFTYFWKKGDYDLFRYCQKGCSVLPIYWHLRQNSLRRLLEVMFRLNLLVVTLCFVMNRPYQFYYFVPLVSFWFMVIYITMAIWPRVCEKHAEERTRAYFFMVIKFILLVTVISLFYMSEVFFEKIFLMRPLKPLFVTSDDSIHEWRFRWQLDRYSVVYGMLFAFGYLILKRYKIIQDIDNRNLFSTGISWMYTLLGLIGLGSYAAFSCLCRNKQECNDVHSYIMFIPIVSFILVRNIHGGIRTRYSSFFAWFGRISLELFISQYHIWLAADTHGVLVMIPSYPVLNVIITSFIFICVSHEISNITIVLTKYAVPNEWKALLRNIIIIGLVLVPLCISRGVI
ncbi:N-acetylneuraminate 9-O-acetyltransferase-like isoform X1 [Ruditapes philippinarum]|uniref:N-acetylneuraminate 9-O-acetyltransferase-like isoform X1 n=1 Tax=Ruditapes philippinarum TaxID=129788 RepID=UPI00295BF80A|nr:N-acetylneuraminate 9-O-acetyltransferase-like isoform X1 [Ruditapes philippinarum]